MKFIKTLTLPALALVPTLAINWPGKKTAVFTTFEVVGAFNSLSNHVLEQAIQYNGAGFSGQLNINYYRKNNMSLYGSLQQQCDSTRRSFQLNVKNQIDYGPVYLTIDVKNDEKTFFTGQATLEKPNRTEYVARGGTLSIPNVCFGVIRNSLINEETYNFTDTNEFLSLDSQSKINLSEFGFIYTPSNFYHVNEAYLEIVDYENVYPNLTKVDGDKTIRIPLTSVNVNKNVSFELNCNMYVNKSSLDMSSIPLEGYEETNSLYVPFSKQMKMCDNEVNIILHESGFDLSKITIPMSFVIDRNAFGFCDDSDYCIHGGVRS